MTAPEGMPPGESTFSRFENRLLDMLYTFDFHKGLVNIYQGDATFWGVIVAKKSHERRLLYRVDRNALSFKVDVHRQLHFENVTVETSEVSENVGGNKEPNVLLATYPGKPAVDESKLSLYPENAGSFNPPNDMEFNELTWDENKGNWRGILKTADQSFDKYVSLCNIWKPRSPMKITPDEQSVRYLFQSHTECSEVIARLKTEVPGFAIVHISWLSFLPKHDVEVRPSCHLCDILTVTENNDVCLWVIVSDSGEEVINTQLQYMSLGRNIKHQILNQNKTVPNLTIRCKLCSTEVTAYDFIEKHTEYQLVQSSQEMLYPKFHEKDRPECLQQCIASLLLWKETPITNYAGQQMRLTLSNTQADFLLRRQKVTYISSPPGTGKTLCGIYLYRDYGKHASVYICPTAPLIQYLQHNGCDAIFVQTDENLNSHITRGTFENKKCVVIDESHKLQWSRASWEKLFILLKDYRDMFLFVFADSEFQCFERTYHHHIADWVWELSREVLKIFPRTEPFSEMYRNTKKIVSFLQHSANDGGGMNVTCRNLMDGDGVQCIVMENLWNNVPENALARYLRRILVHAGASPDATYLVTDVAVLLDAGCGNDKIEAIGQILRRQLPGIITQASDKFPREGIVVDTIDSFAGLDAGLCIFLLSPQGEKDIEDYRYRVFLASRATHKAVFVVSKIDAAFAKYMKFDRFQVSSHLNE